MSQRAEYQKLSSPAYQALFALEKKIMEAGFDRKITNLVKIRASQLNGCVFCLDMHVKEARLSDERELRLHHLIHWRESSLFSEKEKAALEWAEILTRPNREGVADSDYENALRHFSEKELSDLTFVIATINAWNRLGIAFKTDPGSLDQILGLDKAGLR